MDDVARCLLSGQISHDGEVDLLSEVLTSRIQTVRVIVRKPNLALRIGQIKLNLSVWLLNLLPLLGLSLRSGALLSRRTNQVFGGFPVVVSSYALSVLDLR